MTRKHPQIKKIEKKKEKKVSANTRKIQSKKDVYLNRKTGRDDSDKAVKRSIGLK